MLRRRRGVSVAAAASALVFALAVFVLARVRAADDPGGYVGKGQLVVQTAMGAENKITLGGNIALEERGSNIRIDILSLGIPGTDPAFSSILSTQLFPPGGFTIVYDRKVATYTIWSTAKRNYYTSTNASANSQGTNGTALAIGAAGSLFDVFAIAKSLKNASAFTASLSLAGHGTVNGHPATGLDYQYAQSSKSGDKMDVHGRLQLADDLDAVPVQITASAKSKNIPESSLRLDLTTLAKQTPNDADFQTPPGFSRANDIGEVIGKTLPH